MTMTHEKATAASAIERSPADEAYARPAGPESIERAAEGLRSRGFEALIVDDADKARALVLSLVPEGAEVGQGASATLDRLGITEAIEKSGRYDAVRPRTRAMDRRTQMREIRKLGAAPDVQINSVQALTEDGRIVVVSATGSQLGPVGFGAGKVILVVGSQKIVPDLDAALRRIEEYSLPLEDAKMVELYGQHSAIRKMLVLNGDFPGRVTVVLVREPVGV
jgi:hypothetical protein